MPSYVYTVIKNGMVLAFMAKRHAMRFMSEQSGCTYSERYTVEEYQLYYED